MKKVRLWDGFELFMMVLFALFWESHGCLISSAIFYNNLDLGMGPYYYCHYYYYYYCFRYPDYRQPPDGPSPYDYSPIYWHILAARLAFVVVFEVRGREGGVCTYFSISSSG